jgi:MFS family permease
LLIAQGISTLGTRMAILAIPWFVLGSTGSAFDAGLASFSEMLPYVGAALLGGPLVDRLGPKRMSVRADLVATAALGLVPLAFVANVLSFPLLCVLVAVLGVFRGVGDSAKTVLLPYAVDHSPTPMERAAGLVDGVSRTASLIGAPIAGVLLAIIAAPSVLGIDAATFALAAVAVAVTMPATRTYLPGAPHLGSEPFDGAPTGSGGAYLAELRRGFVWLRGDRLLCAIGLMVGTTNTLDQGLTAVLIPVWVRSHHDGAAALGVIFGAMALGAVAGNAVATWLGPHIPRRLGYGVGFMMAGAPKLAVLALAPSIAIVVAVLFIGGLGAGWINPILGAVEYERVPRELQARVLGAFGALAWAGLPFGALLAGGLVAGVGLTPALIAIGSVYFATTLAPFVFPVWHAMDRATPAPEVPAAGV